MGLTVKGIAKLGPGKHADGGGLYLVKKGGSASWIFRYQVGAKETSMGLGPLRDFSLDEARELARDQRRLLHKGTDPLTAKKDSLTAHAKAAAQRISFDEAARKCFDIRSKEWTSKSSKEQFLTSLQLHAYPIIGKKLVADIDVADVVKVLEPIWMTKTVTAQRVRGRIEYILDWAKSLGYRTGENPAVWAGHLELSFPNRSKVAPVEHFAALPFRNVPTFMAELRARQGVGPRAMEFLILCASRTYEVIDAKWSEIDFETLNWTIPKNRMKKRNHEHVVPLTTRAIEILKGLPVESDFIFIGGRRNGYLSKMVFPNLLKAMKRDDVTTTHGFRSTFRDWAGETTNYPSDICEAALSHALGNKTQQAYQRGTLLEKRRALMADWAAFLSKPASDASVTPIRMEAVA